MSNPDANCTDRPTILCIDDQPKIVDSIARHLSLYNVNVKKALHGMQGIWIANTEPVDLVVTDLKMPFADGIEVIEVIGHVPVIAVTGVNEPQVKKQLLDAGAAAVLFKPVDTPRLLEEIGKFISLTECVSGNKVRTQSS